MANTYINKANASNSYYVDKRTTVNAYPKPKSNDVVDSNHITPHSGVRSNADYPSGV